MKKVFIVDLSLCNGCHNCQIACKDEHVGNEWLPYAKPQPLTGHFWLKLVEKERGAFPKVKVSYIPTLCYHCDEAPCIPACPVDAIYKREDGLVIIDPIKCNGCRDCIYACPYEGIIYFNEASNIAQKCTGCAHLVDDGDTPRCVDACPTDALRFGDEENMKDLIEKARVIKPELEYTKPRVLYLKSELLKPFITGAVYDPEKDECVQGAKVTLVDELKGEKRETFTDEFGDFWFRGLETSSYEIRIEKDGYFPASIKNIRAEDDANIGDIKLYPALKK